MAEEITAPSEKITSVPAAEAIPPPVVVVPSGFWQKLKNSFGTSREIRFAWETLKRLFVFTIVALAAFGLDYIVEILKRYRAPTFITYTLTGVEVLALIADVIWFLAGLFKQVEESLKEILKGRIALVLGCVVLLVVGVILSPYLKSWCLDALNAIRQYLLN